MSDLLYIDLLIENGNFVLNTGKEPELCNNRKSIGQDIIHSILESGLATQLVGERSPTLRADIGGNDETDIAGSQTVTTGKDLIEKIGQIRKSVAAVQQQIIAPVVWIGSGTINVAQLMLDTLDVVKELAEQTASHTHSNTGAPTNAGAIRNTGTKADTLNGKYSPVIGK